MALIKFQLHHTHANGTRQIRISFLCEDGRYYKESAKEWVKPEHFKNSRLIASAKNSTVINQQLDNHESRLYAAIRDLRSEGTRITPEALKAKLTGRTEGFWNFYDAFLLNPPESIGTERMKHYRAMYNLLQKFNPRLDFQDFNQTFADGLTKFMRGEKYKTDRAGVDHFYNDSTIRYLFKRLRALLGHAKKQGVIQSIAQFSTSARGMDAGAVFLSEAEIKQVYNVQGLLKLRGIETYKDIFVLGTQIGVRVSDLKILPENITELNGKKYANLSNRKTKTSVIVPLSSLAIEILEKYNWRTPDFEETLMNIYIKLICDKAGINTIVIHRSIVGGKMKEESFQKCELVSSHTMRRSFATNRFLDGVPIPVIMKITGHKTISSFMKYVRVEGQQSAEIMGSFLK